MNSIRLVFITVLALNSFGCSNVPNDKTKNQVSISDKTTNLDNLKIETLPEKYAPFMSSSVGILLTPTNIDTKAYKLVFKTKEGLFLSWGKDTNNQVKELGKEVVYDKDLYWSYNFDNKFSQDEITLTVFDKANDKKLKELSLKVVISKEGFASVVK